MKRSRPFLEISHDDEASIISAARDTQPVCGLTHNFYRYPARFSPAFVRAAIEALSSPGDLILDPFMGGGTSLVEAIAAGRNAVGADISQLASFVTSVKTTLLKESELSALTTWSEKIPKIVNIRRQAIYFDEYANAGYYKHLDGPRWRLRKAIELALASAIGLHSQKLEDFARGVVLRTAQWALDSRKHLPSVSDFRRELVVNAADMISGARALRKAVYHYGRKPVVHCFNRSTVGLESEPVLATIGTPKLIVTSPPYPGVHILYHRWQVDGRKETPAPFWIANKLDGAGSSYYTMGDRKHPGLATYFATIEATMSSVAKLADMTVLGHQSSKVTTRHYNQAKMIDAVRAYQEVLLAEPQD